MNKLILLAAGASMASAAAYYVSPARRTDLDVPPVVTALPPEAAMKELRGLSLHSFVQQYGGLRDVEETTTGGMTKVAPDRLQMDLRFLGERLVILSFTVRPGVSGGTEVDIQSTLPDSRLRRSKELHPYDLKAIASIADMLATEYVSSVLNRQRVASDREMGPRLEAQLGFDKDQSQAFGHRFQTAIAVAYRDRLRGQDYEVSDRWVQDAYDDAPTDAERAASEASEAARDAAAEASAAAQEAYSAVRPVPR